MVVDRRLRSRITEQQCDWLRCEEPGGRTWLRRARPFGGERRAMLSFVRPSTSRESGVRRDARSRRKAALGRWRGEDSGANPASESKGPRGKGCLRPHAYRSPGTDSAAPARAEDERWNPRSVRQVGEGAARLGNGSGSPHRRLIDTHPASAGAVKVGRETAVRSVGRRSPRARWITRREATTGLFGGTAARLGAHARDRNDRLAPVTLFR